MGTNPTNTGKGPKGEDIEKSIKKIEEKNQKLFGGGGPNIQEEKNQGIVKIDEDIEDLIDYANTIDQIDQNIKKKIEEIKKKNPNFMDEIKKFYNLDEKKLMIALGNKTIFKKAFLIPCYSSYQLYEYMEEKRKEVKDKEEIYKKSKSKDDEIQLEAKINRFVKDVNEKKKEIGNRLRFSLRPSIGSTGILGRLGAKITLQKFGGLHAALLLNHTILEWGCGFCGDSLILPYPDLKTIYLAINLDDEISEKQTSFISRLWQFVKNMEFIKALQFLFSKEFQLKTLAEDELDLIAELCVDYNKNKYYSPAFQNCQIFVEELLNKINVKHNFDGEILKIIDKLKKGQEEVKIEFRGTEFQTSKELYDYVKKIDFSKLSKNDRTLLFSYERIFKDLNDYDNENKSYQSSTEMKDFWNKLYDKYDN